MTRRPNECERQIASADLEWEILARKMGGCRHHSDTEFPLCAKGSGRRHGASQSVTTHWADTISLATRSQSAKYASHLRPFAIKWNWSQARSTAPQNPNPRGIASFSRSFAPALQQLFCQRLPVRSSTNALSCGSVCTVLLHCSSGMQQCSESSRARDGLTCRFQCALYASNCAGDNW